MATRKKASRESKAPEVISVGGEKIEAIHETFAEKLHKDRAFVIALIESPVKAFRAYGYNGDEIMMSMLNGMSENLYQRAVKVFTEVLRVGAMVEKGCDACNGCRACKACGGKLF